MYIYTNTENSNLSKLFSKVLGFEICRQDKPNARAKINTKCSWSRCKVETVEEAAAVNSSSVKKLLGQNVEVEGLEVLLAIMEVEVAVKVAVAVGAVVVVVVVQVQRLCGCSLACSSQLPCSWSRHLTHVIGRWWCWILTFNNEGGANGQSTRQCIKKEIHLHYLICSLQIIAMLPVGMSSPINIRKLLSTCFEVSVLQQFFGP